MGQRLIYADALMRDIEKYHLSDGKFQHWVEVQPTIDAVPVKHGKWIETEENHGFDNEVRNKALSCSVCRVAFRIFDYAQIEDFRYCPNCGARMDEE